MIRRAIKQSDSPLASIQKISKFIEGNFTVNESFKRYLRKALKRLEENNVLVRVRASYKLKSSKRKSPARKRSQSPKRKEKKVVEKEDGGKKKEKGKRKKKEDPKVEKPKRKKKSDKEEEKPKKREKKAEVKKKRGGDSSPAKVGESLVSVADSKYDHFWQYEDGIWKDYDVEASDTVEEVYQNYLSNRGDNDVRAVHSGQWEYQVDFMALKQTNIQHPNHTVRNIRRVANTKSL